MKDRIKMAAEVLPENAGLPTHLAPTHSKRLATLVAQPITIRLPFVSKISSATVSVNLSASLPISMTRVSLCVCVQAPAELKTNASDAAL